MKYIKTKSEDLIKRVEFLECMGFTSHHNDSNVTFGNWENIFDFSAIELSYKNVVHVIIQEMFKSGVALGEENIQNNLKKLLNLR